MRGITKYLTENNMPVMFLHHTADPAKDHMTPAGAVWREKEAQSYPGGLQGPAWLQEMDIRFDVRDTARVWPSFDDRINEVTIPDFDIRQYEHWPVYVGYDYGPQEPTAFTPIAWASKSECYQIDEIYIKGASVYEQARLIKSKPYYDRIRGFWGDPSIWQRTQQNGPIVTSVGQIFQDEYDIDMRRGQNFIGSDAAFIHLLDSVLWQKNDVKFKIFASCSNTIKELRLLAWSQKVTQQKNSTMLETIENKNVHAFDALKYVMLELYKGVAPHALGPQRGSVDWEIAQMERMRNTFQYVLNR